MRLVVEFDIDDDKAPDLAHYAVDAILFVDRSKWIGRWDEGMSRIIPGLGLVRYREARYQEGPE